MGAGREPEQVFADELLLLLRVPYPIIAVRGAEEAYVCAVLARLTASQQRLLRWSHGAPLGVWDGRSEVTPQAGDVESGAAAALLEGLEAIGGDEGPAVFVLLEPEAALDDARVQRRLRELAPRMSRRQQSIVLLGPGVWVPASLRHEVAIVDAPLPSRAVIGGVLDRALPAARHPALPRERLVSAALGLTRAEAHRAFIRARLANELSGGGLGFAWDAQVLQEKQRAIAQGDIVDFVAAEEGLGEVGGLEDLKEWLRTRRAAFSEEARRFGLPVPRGLLLVGVQGCGKSLMAKAVARHWGLPLLRLDLGRVFAGDRAPDAALSQALRVASALAPSVLWVDEIEKGFGASADPATTRVLGSLLTWLQEKEAEVFFVATANEVEALPPELLRKGRFDEMFFVDLPDRAARVQILGIHVARRGRDAGAFDLDGLAARTEHFSGAELEQVVVAGLYEAFAEGRELEGRDLEQAAEQLIPLYVTREDAIKRLREWARTRARFAAHDQRVLEFFTPS